MLCFIIVDSFRSSRLLKSNLLCYRAGIFRMHYFGRKGHSSLKNSQQSGFYTGKRKRSHRRILPITFHFNGDGNQRAVQYASYSIANDGTLEDLQKEVDRLVENGLLA